MDFSGGGVRRRRGGGGLLLTASLGLSCLLSLVVTRRSTAFVASAPGTLVGRRGTLATCSSRQALGATGIAGVVPSRRARRTRLGMEVIANNPITSKVYGRADNAKGKNKSPDLNEEITVETVRCVISVKGMDEQLGVMSTVEALARAQDEGLDLVMISADAEPPVVKIIDYGKYKYKQDRRKKDNKAKHKATEMKEVKMSYKIDSHDYEVRLKNAKKFVSQGHRVRVVVQFRGREQAHMDLGTVLLNKVAKDLEGLALAEPKRREGNRLSMIVFPKATS